MIVVRPARTCSRSSVHVRSSMATLVAAATRAAVASAHARRTQTHRTSRIIGIDYAKGKPAKLSRGKSRPQRAAISGVIDFLAQPHRLSRLAQAQVQHLHCHGEGHREVDVAFRDVEPKAFS